MMIIKKILLVIFSLIILTSCGYDPIYSKKIDLNKLIKNYELSGDKKINRRIVSTLNFKENTSSKYILILDSNKKLEIVSKDKSGNVSVYKTSITVNISLKNNKKNFKEKIFIKSFTYNSMKNKFNLSQYQKDVEASLVDDIIDDILIFLNS